MKNGACIIAMLLCCISIFSQQLKSGEYDDGLRLSYDSESKKVTGYYESYTGMDERTGNPRFSCIFYIEGTLSGKINKIKTYYPDSPKEFIEGTLEIVSSTSVKIRLKEEHGGCWNVQPFARELVGFDLEKSLSWKKISYIKADKTHFHSGKSTAKKTKVYLVKNDFVCIEKVEGDWAYCIYYGTKISKGWIKRSDIF